MPVSVHLWEHGLTRRPIWVEFLCSLLSAESFFSECTGFYPLTENQYSICSALIWIYMLFSLKLSQLSFMRLENNVNLKSLRPYLSHFFLCSLKTWWRTIRRRFYWMNHWPATIAHFCEACTYLHCWIKTRLISQKWRKRKFLDMDWFWNYSMVRTVLFNALYNINEINVKKVSYFGRYDWSKCYGWFVTGYWCFHSCIASSLRLVIYELFLVFSKHRTCVYYALTCSRLSVRKGERNCGEREKNTGKDCGSGEASACPSPFFFFFFFFTLRVPSSATNWSHRQKCTPCKQSNLCSRHFFNFASWTREFDSLKASFFRTQIDFESLKYLSKLSMYLMLCLYSLIISELFTIKKWPVTVWQKH